MLSNPNAPLHPSLPDERDGDGTDTEFGRERQRGRKERRMDGKQRNKRGARDRKHLRRGGEMMPDNMCVIYLCGCECAMG